MSSLAHKTAGGLLGGIAAMGVAALLVQKQRQRRRTAWQRSHVEKAAAQVKEMGFDVLCAADEEEAVALQIRSFNGSENRQAELGLDWICGSELRGRFDDSRRLAVMHCNMVETFRKTILLGGLGIGVRDAAGCLTALLLACPMIAEDGSRGGYLQTNIEIPDMNAVVDEAHYGKYPKLRAEWFYLGPGNLLKRIHDECAPGPHWYVNIVAVDPCAQGQGLAGRLLHAVNAIADTDSVPCYLDTVGERNRSIYERAGYKVCDRGFELNVPGDPDPLTEPTNEPCIIRCYGMVRLNVV